MPHPIWTGSLILDWYDSTFLSDDSRLLLAPVDVSSDEFTTAFLYCDKNEVVWSVVPGEEWMHVISL